MSPKKFFSLSLAQTETVGSELPQQLMNYEEQTEDCCVFTDLTGMKPNRKPHTDFFANPKTWQGRQLQNADLTFSLRQIRSDESA